jgi:hypothetical protein
MKLDREGNFVFVGTYDLGDEVVGLLAEIGGTGGCFHVAHTAADGKPKHSKCLQIPYIVVGINYRRWCEVLEVLLHEVFELLYTRLGVRFRPSDGWSRSHADYLFNMTHEQFTEAIARSGGFLSMTQPDLCRIFKHVRANKNIKPL